jgi:hypothetical protein
MSQILNSGYAKSKLGFNGTRNLTWAQRPNAAQYQNEIIYISDVGIGGSYWTSNGTYWSPLNGEVTLAQSGASVSVTGTLTETALATYTMPGGLMSANGQLEIFHFWSFTNSANSKTLRVRLSAVGGGSSGNAYLSNTLTTFSTVKGITCIRNANSTSSQKGWGTSSASSSGLGTSGALTSSTRDTGSNLDVCILGLLGNSGETITLEAYSIVYRG